LVRSYQTEKLFLSIKRFSGPCIAGIIVYFSNWRVIIWVQVAMIGIGFVLAVFFLPASKTDTHCKKFEASWQAGLTQFNPITVFKLMARPNIIFTHLSCGLLSWSQYFLLAAPRQILGQKFHLTSPLTSGLFYIAPGVGFLLGTVIGGWYSDLVVRKWIAKRNGTRMPQDRLNSGLVAFFIVIPVSSLLYGWGLQYIDIEDLSGGLAFPMVLAFCTAAGLLTAFASLNTYCAGKNIATFMKTKHRLTLALEAIPKNRREVITGKYVIQYIFGASACAATDPLITRIHVGPACTIGRLKYPKFKMY
jgi:hypothetical protein